MSDVPRVSILTFAKWMEAKLRRHDDEFVGWAACDADFLLSRLAEEVRELRQAIRHGSANAIRSEAADVANFAMMLADNAAQIVEHER